MTPFAKSAFNCLLFVELCVVMPTTLHALPPNASDLDRAISTGDFTGYLKYADDWLNQKTPNTFDEAVLTGLVNDPYFHQVLDQRQLISKTGAESMAAFAKAEPANQKFLGWLLKSSPAMDLYLEASVPISLADREENSYKLNTAALDIWKKILKSDPEAGDGLCLKLAVATAIAPPGSSNIGAGGAKTPEDTVVRYTYYKTAHQKQELFPSFDHLTVWEYTRIVSSGASDEDLSWARQMINTFRPDLRADELVVNSTSLVWRRHAPEAFWNKEVNYGNFKHVLAGGGACGPRSSWSVMVCHAFGIPAIGVAQPKHACVAYKAANPKTEPQPGSAWKVGYGRGWEFSKLMGLKGPDFIAGMEKRSDPAKFSSVEHLRWLASALTLADKAASVMKIAHKINDSIAVVKTDLTASLKPEEAEAEPGAKASSESGKSKSAAVKSAQPAGTGGLASPIQAEAGVIHVEAGALYQTGGKPMWGGEPHVLLMDCFTGGKQIYFQQQMKEQWADYAVDVPETGTYSITLKAACINEGQVLEIVSGETTLATVDIPLNFGLWAETKPVLLILEKGRQTLRIQTPKSVAAENLKRGVALRSFELKRFQ